MQMSIALSEQCVSTLLRLPIHYFSHRLSGDLTNRILSIDRISRGVQRQLVESLVEVAMSAVYLIAILILSPQLAMIVSDRSNPDNVRDPVYQEYPFRRRQFATTRADDAARGGHVDGATSRWSANDSI